MPQKITRRNQAPPVRTSMNILSSVELFLGPCNDDYFVTLKLSHFVQLARGNIFAKSIWILSNISIIICSLVYSNMYFEYIIKVFVTRPNIYLYHAVQSDGNK